MNLTDYKNYDNRYGGPFDRGLSDSYYHRGRIPHYYLGDSYQSEHIVWFRMTEQQVVDYNAGYDWNEQFGDKKEYV
jgi:hypothetical protein